MLKDTYTDSKIRGGFHRRSLTGGNLLPVQVRVCLAALLLPPLLREQMNNRGLFCKCRELDEVAEAERGALWGVPFAVKDNIDVEGATTTCACPDFAYTPSETAKVVAAVLEQGAIYMGKTNLDQFACGLVGTRSPYGVPENAFHPALVPGGSSSGSAVAVAKGMVSFAFGTDTAGSGRVPAGLNGIVGMKPTVGLCSTVGVAPACRSLDCPSVFALSVEDGRTILALIENKDPYDHTWRPRFYTEVKNIQTGFNFAVPAPEFLRFDGPGGKSVKSGTSSLEL